MIFAPTLPFEDWPEALLQFIWQERAFASVQINGQALRVLDPGQLNHHQGPDFLHARLRAGTIELHGHVEIHRRSEDWYRHGHHRDPHYNPVVLHVCMQSRGDAIKRQDGTLIPEVILQPDLPPSFWQRYDQLQLATTHIPCQPLLGEVTPSITYAWIAALGRRRLSRKVQHMRDRIQATTSNWEHVLWEELLVTMGGPQNQAAFRTLAERLPWDLIKGYTHHPHQVEAFLFGSLGLLAHPKDAYHADLCEQWQHLQHKHALDASFPPALSFFRLRPPAFPTLRLAQTAALVHTFPRIGYLLEQTAPQLLMEADIEPSAYWQTHYRFGEPSKPHAARLGVAQKHILLVNVCLPLMCLYQEAHGCDQAFDQALKTLATLPPEINHLTKRASLFGIEHTHAGISQGLMELQKGYCKSKRCLSCQIGLKLMGRDTHPAVSDS